MEQSYHECANILDRVCVFFKYCKGLLSCCGISVIMVILWCVYVCGGGGNERFLSNEH